EGLYKFFGYFSLFQVFLTISMQYLPKLMLNRNRNLADGPSIASTTSISTSEDVSELVISKRSCGLCLDYCHHATATTCGHLFCWNCICKCLQQKVCIFLVY